MEYAVFSDESYISAERFRSIGAVSFPRVFISEIKENIKEILKSSGVNEFKWKKLKDSKYRFCAEKLIHYLFEGIFPKELRVDVIVWDTRNSRHNIRGRDDIANFERMFFHLMKSVMTRREKESDWYVYPDERMEIDWEIIQDCLESVGKWREYFDNPLLGDAFSVQFFNIRELRHINSKKTPCCQIADLFAGMAVFSKNYYEKFCEWCKKVEQQHCLFDSSEDVQFSKMEEERLYILKLFVDRCKKRRLGVSIKTNRCLNTPNPDNPINFWHYIPQHSLDKAPVRD
jgi:hypothetical protein